MNIISYQGSKRNELKIIEKYEPLEYKTFVDVFGGGANVSLFYLEKNKNVVYNDINKDICELLKILQDEEKTKDLINEYGNICKNHNLEYFYKVFDKEIKISSSSRLIYLSCICFRSMIHNRMPKINNDILAKPKKINYYTKFNNTLKNMNILNEDYKKILEKYKDDEDAFLYLDPPYIEKKIDAYGVNFTIEDLIYIKDFLKTCKCKIFLHIDLTGWTYINFKEYIKFTYPIRYSMSNKKKDVKDIYGKYHCIINNYEID
jgi:DNA adenine methylase